MALVSPAPVLADFDNVWRQFSGWAIDFILGTQVPKGGGGGMAAVGHQTQAKGGLPVRSLSAHKRGAHMKLIEAHH